MKERQPEGRSLELDAYGRVVCPIRGDLVDVSRCLRCRFLRSHHLSALPAWIVCAPPDSPVD